MWFRWIVSSHFNWLDPIGIGHIHHAVSSNSTNHHTIIWFILYKMNRSSAFTFSDFLFARRRRRWMFYERRIDATTHIKMRERRLKIMPNWALITQNCDNAITIMNFEESWKPFRQLSNGIKSFSKWYIQACLYPSHCPHIF